HLAGGRRRPAGRGRPRADATPGQSRRGGPDRRLTAPRLSSAGDPEDPRHAQLPVFVDAAEVADQRPRLGRDRRLDGYLAAAGPGPADPRAFGGAVLDADVVAGALLEEVAGPGAD